MHFGTHAFLHATYTRFTHTQSMPSSAGELISKKDAKIGSLISQAKLSKKEGQKAAQAAARLVAERAESDSLIAELRCVVSEFENELDGVKVWQATELDLLRSRDGEIADLRSENERLARQVVVLTRALGALEQGDLALDSAARDVEIDRLEIELNKQKEREEFLQTELSQRVQVSELFEVRAELTRERIERDQLFTDFRGMEARARQAEAAARESRAECECLRVESAKHRVDFVDLGERFSETTADRESSRKELVELRMRLNAMNEQRNEFEGLIRNRDTCIESKDEELMQLRDTVSELDREVRNLAQSLQCESESNSNLSLRLLKIETELREKTDEIIKLKRFENNAKKIDFENSQLREENDKLRRDVLMTKNELCETHARAKASESIHKSLKSEITRLHTEIDAANSKADQNAIKYTHMAKEGEKIKSLLANDTLAKLGRFFPN